jgi:hypothetical protein
VGRGGTSFEDYTARTNPVGRELRERMSVEAMKVYHLTIQENGHSRRFVYEDRDQALTRLAEAITAGLDARLDEVVRDAAGPPIQFACFLPIWGPDSVRSPMALLDGTRAG